MKQVIALFGLIAVSSVSHAATIECRFGSYPLGSGGTNFILKTNDSNAQTRGRYQVNVVTDSEGGLVAGSIEDTVTHSRSSTYSPDKKSVNLFLQSSSNTASLQCDPVN